MSQYTQEQLDAIKYYIENQCNFELMPIIERDIPEIADPYLRISCIVDNLEQIPMQLFYRYISHTADDNIAFAGMMNFQRADEILESIQARSV